MMKGGQVIAETLVQEGVPYIFGICGHGNVGILDALYDVRDKIQLISPRHEQCAGHMADAYFRVKHKPVATLTSTGPGSANMVMSLATALSAGLVNLGGGSDQLTLSSGGTLSILNVETVVGGSSNDVLTLSTALSGSEA
jgi:thiamine pyrophosphate-dependent acetolactate synthase large subunit-like protein